MAWELGAPVLQVHCNSQLVVKEVEGEYEAWDERMLASREEVLKLIKLLNTLELMRLSRSEKNHVNVLSQLASFLTTHNLRVIPVEYLE